MPKKRRPSASQVPSPPPADGIVSRTRTKVIWLVTSVTVLVAGIAIFAKNLDDIVRLIEKYTTNRSGTISVADASTNVSVSEIEGPPPEKKPFYMVDNSIDFLLKNEFGTAFKQCAYLFREDMSLISVYLRSTDEFIVPSGVTALRKQFRIFFLATLPFPYKKVRFRITCDGVTSNLISADVFDESDWSRNIKPWPK